MDLDDYNLSFRNAVLFAEIHGVTFHKIIHVHRRENLLLTKVSKQSLYFNIWKVYDTDRPV
jgi:hypothetical protein